MEDDREDRVVLEDHQGTMPTPPTDAEVAAAEKDPDVKAKTDAIINQWVRDHIHNSPVSRWTEAYAHLVAMLPKLRDLLLAKE